MILPAGYLVSLIFLLAIIVANAVGRSQRVSTGNAHNPADLPGLTVFPYGRRQYDLGHRTSTWLSIRSTPGFSLTASCRSCFR